MFFFFFFLLESFTETIFIALKLHFKFNPFVLVFPGNHKQGFYSWWIYTPGGENVIHEHNSPTKLKKQNDFPKLRKLGAIQMSDLLILVDLAAFTGVSPAAGRTCTMTQACSLDKLTGLSGWGIWSSGAQAGTWGHTGGEVKQGLGPVPDSQACLPQPEENLFWVKIMFYFIILIIQQKARHHLHLMHWLRDRIELVGCLLFLDTAHTLNQTPFGTEGKIKFGGHP